MKGSFTRRQVLELGLGSTILGACGRTATAAGADTASSKQEEHHMPTVKEFNAYGEELERELVLRSAPIAVKMLKSEADIPKGAYRPKKDKNKHYAQCQVFSLSRRDRLTVAMLKDDNWCLGPLLAYGLVETPDMPAGNPAMQYKRFKYGTYVGILTAPLKSAVFEPDLVMIYSDTNQLRDMLLSLKEEEKPKVRSNFFPISCAFCITNPILDNEYWINLPDPGEYVRALTQPGEMIFSIPVSKLPDFMDGLRKFYKESMFAHEQMMMESDFSQPDIYKKMFEGWGMEHSK
ncbi:MAG: DUF169 domain-containing protein [Acidobacteria bacterium]|nr:DUF169 domain-containing protein [Acidobacteriota bacterium]